MKTKLLFLFVILLGFTFKVQSQVVTAIYDWESEMCGIDHRFTLIAGWPSIMSKSYFDGTSQHIHSNCQIAMRTNFPLSQTGSGMHGWYHTISFKYVTSTPVRFVVYLSQGCGWQYFTLPIATIPTYISFQYFAPRQLYLFWYNPACKDSWFEMDDLILDPPLTDETIILPNADTSDITNPNLIKFNIPLNIKPGFDSSYDILGRKIK